MNTFSNRALRATLFVGTIAGTFIGGPTLFDRLADRLSVASSPINEPPVALSDLSNGMPDGSELKSLFGAARTVADLAKANEFVKASIARLARVEAGLNGWHRDASTVCAFVGAIDSAQLRLIVVKAAAMQAIIADIERRMIASRNRLAPARIPKPQGPAPSLARPEPADARLPYSAQAELNAQYLLAYEEFARMNVDVTLRTQTIARLASVSIPTMAASCSPTEIPPLFAEAEK